MSKVVFGLNGRTKEQIRTAVDCGYTIFDGGDTYDDTAKLLCEAWAEAGKDPRECRLIYKLDKDYEEQELSEHLGALAETFGGQLYCAIVHHSEYAENYAEVLRCLKEEGTILHIGLGETLEGDSYDCFEINVERMVTKKWMLDSPQPVTPSGVKKDVYFYNLIKTAAEIYRAGGVEDGNCMLMASYVLVKIQNWLGEDFQIIPILSSGREDVIRNNVDVDYEALCDEMTGEEYKLLEKCLQAVIVQKENLPLIGEMEEEYKTIFLALLTERDWSGESEEDRAFFADTSAREREREAKLALFSKEAQNKYYVCSKGIFSIGELINMLYAEENCSRVSVYNELMDAFCS